MAQQKIELRKIRDLSENLNDTFTFIRQNFKPLLTSFLAIAGIFMLAASALNVLYQSKLANDALNISVPGGTSIFRSAFWMINKTFVVGRILEWVSWMAVITAITCYIKVCDKKDREAPTIDEVWMQFKKYFLTILVYSIPVTLLTFAGLLFCLVPGIYFAVVFAPFSVAVIIDDLRFGEAWDKCFAIIKNSFWGTFAVYFIVNLIYLVTAGLISAGFTIFTGNISYFTLKDISRPASIALSVVNIFSHVFYIIVYISVILHYFSLTERHEGTGMMSRIDRLGDTQNDTHDIQEQY